MEIATSSNLDWTHIDEQSLAQFLDTPTGRRFIPKLLEQAPIPLEAGDTNAILIRSGKVLGCQEIVKLILALSHSQPQPQLSTNIEYPPLENDKAWPAPPDEPALQYKDPETPTTTEY